MPVKTRDLHNHHFDSTFWDDIRFRDDEFVIAIYAKSGTTWMQQIVSQLIFDGAECISTAAIGPWVDLRVPPREVKLPEIEAQTHRRFLKTHLPVDALVFSPKAKYIYIGHDPPRCDVEPVQPPFDGQSAVVRCAEPDSGPRRTRNRTAPGRPGHLFPRLACQ